MASAAATGETNATQLLTPYDLLSSGLSNETSSSVDISEPDQPEPLVVQQNQKMEEKVAREEEESTNDEVQADKMVCVRVCVCLLGISEFLIYG